jgi:proteasome lid subunit RPN8/RPN11
MSCDALLNEMLSPEGTPERGGLLLNDGTIVEFTNHHPEPIEGFTPDPFDVLPHLDAAIGTWHTHPGGTANLSAEDASTFVGWPTWRHAIIGTDGVRWYAVKHGAVING